MIEVVKISAKPPYSYSWDVWYAFACRCVLWIELKEVMRSKRWKNEMPTKRRRCNWNNDTTTKRRRCYSRSAGPSLGQILIPCWVLEFTDRFHRFMEICYNFLFRFKARNSSLFKCKVATGVRRYVTWNCRLKYVFKNAKHPSGRSWFFSHDASLFASICF